MSPDPTAPVLDVQEVSVHFGGVRALDSVSLTVRPGQVTGLIGPNGAGKTTLFNVLSGLQRPDRGRVYLEGREVSSLGPHRRAQLGLARTFQRLELFWSLTVAENVQVGAESSVQWWKLRRRTTKSRAVGAPGVPAFGGSGVAALLDRVGLAGLNDRPVDSLPTGQARLVELARALSIGPRLLLLDEPGSGLDDSESAALGDLLVDLAADGMAVLLVEHDMDLLMRVCSHVYVFDYGQLIAAGSPAEVRTNVAVQSAYLGGSPAASQPGERP